MSYDPTDIRHVRQRRADLDAQIAALKAEGFKLSGLTTRSPEQTARLQTIDAALATATSEAAEVAGHLSQCERAAQAERAAGHAVFSTGGDGAPLVRRGRRFEQMFPSASLTMGGFGSAEEFLATIHSGLADPRLVAVGGSTGLHAINTGAVPSEGGFAVPTQMFAQWLNTSLESEIVRPRADVFPMTSSDGVAPGWDDGNHSSTLFGGFTGQWLGEGDEITVETPKVRLIAMKARKLAILTRASNELAADGMSFEEQLGQAITKALGWFLDSAFLTGNGASKPLGVLNSGCLITVAKETNQAAATINYTNIAKMFARLTPSSYQNAVWVCNSTAIPQLLALSVAVGTGGSHVPVLSETGGTWRMLTLPVIFTEKVPALGTVGDIGLYDFSQYNVGMRAAFTLAKSGHAGFATDTSYYRGIIRVDGQPKLSAPITPKAGETQSPFVTLATRA